MPRLNVYILRTEFHPSSLEMDYFLALIKSFQIPQGIYPGAPVLSSEKPELCDLAEIYAA